MWKTLVGWLGGDSSEEKKRPARPHRQRPADEDASVEPGSIEPASTAPEGPPRLAPLDAAMIQSRLKALGLTEVFEEHHQEELKRVILEQCRQRREGVWWTPLATFVAEVRYQARHLPLEVVNIRATSGGRLLDSVAAFTTVMDAYRVGVQTISTESGEYLSQDQAVEDGEYRMSWLFENHDASEPLALRVRKGRLDLAHLAAGFNEALEARHKGDRVLVLPPHDGQQMVVCCPAPIAQRAETSGWGTLGPKGQTG